MANERSLEEKCHTMMPGPAELASVDTICLLGEERANETAKNVCKVCLGGSELPSRKQP